MKYLAAALLMAVTPMAAIAADPWYRVGTTSTGTVIYAQTKDLAAGRPGMRAAKMWIKQDASRDSKVSWTEARILYSVDCVKETTRAITYAVYEGDGSVDTFDAPDPKVEPVIPETHMAVAVGLLCAATDSDAAEL